jgi:hypothetical protein
LLRPCVTVHKTLQWRGHNRFLGEISPKARLVAITGICEFIKNDYLGRFWDSYEKLIGWKSDSTVYNWIWDKGFKENGIELIRSFSGRREFVQTLILESGIPKRRVKDIIEFFIIYRRYFRNFKNIEELIVQISEGNKIVRSISAKERKKLQNICINALDYTRAFAIAVEKLDRVFDFIETSDEILSANITENIDLIHESTGIHPFEILRDQEQLLKLYNRIIGIVTPARLRKIIARQTPATIVTRPSGKKIYAGKYKFFEYGEHIIGGTQYVCLPAPNIEYDELENFQYNRLINIQGGYIYKSKRKIKIFVDGNIRYDLSMPFFGKASEGRKSRGFVFFSEILTASTITIKDEQDHILERIMPVSGFNCSTSLSYDGNFQQNRHELKIDINNFRIYEPRLSNKKIILTTGRSEDNSIYVRLSKKGFGRVGYRRIKINYPIPEKIRVKVLKEETLDPVGIDGNSDIFRKNLDETMLFSPFTGWQFSPVKSGKVSRFGHKKFVLFKKNDIPEEALELSNLKILSKGSCGGFNVLILEWQNRTEPCRVEVTSNIKKYEWNFERYFDFELALVKMEKGEYGGLQLASKFGLSADEFGLTLEPKPDNSLLDLLYWNVVVNEKPPMQVRLSDGPKGTEVNNVIELSPEEFFSIIGTTIKGESSGICRIEISICTEDLILATDKIWVFPDLNVSPTGVIKEGNLVESSLEIGGTKIPVQLQDKDGDSIAKLEISIKENNFEIIERNYYQKVPLPKSAIEIPIKLTPKISGCRLYSKSTGKIEVLRNLFKREINDFKLILLPYCETNPSIYINEQKHKYRCERNGQFLILNLDQLKGMNNFKNNVKIAFPSLEENFYVTYRLIVDSVEISKKMVENFIFGKISFAGPKKSGVQFLVYKIDGNVQEVHGKYDISSNNAFKRGGPINFQININEPVDKNSEYVVKLNLLKDLQDKKRFNEYGTTWIVGGSVKKPDEVFKTLFDASKSCYQNGLFFKAKEFLNMAIEKDPTADRKKLTEYEHRIDKKIYNLKINSIINQAKKLLRSEYFLDIK